VLFGGVLLFLVLLFGARAQATGCSPPRMSPGGCAPSSFISLRGAPGALRTRARCGFAADQPVRWTITPMVCSAPRN